MVTSAESDNFISGSMVLRKGEAVGKHRTSSGEEILVINCGTAKVTSAGRSKLVKAPAVVLIPKHTLHNVECVSDEVLRYVYVVANV